MLLLNSNNFENEVERSEELCVIDLYADWCMPCKMLAPILLELEGDCYVCNRINKNLSAMISTAVYLFESDGAFKEKFKKAPYFCLPHYRAMMDYASKKMGKRQFAEFYDTAKAIEDKYLETLSDDVSWFCKKFDYRYDDEPWYNSKDSVARAIKFLSGDFSEKSDF